MEEGRHAVNWKQDPTAYAGIAFKEDNSTISLQQKRELLKKAVEVLRSLTTIVEDALNGGDLEAIQRAVDDVAEGVITKIDQRIAKYMRKTENRLYAAFQDVYDRAYLLLAARRDNYKAH